MSLVKKASILSFTQPPDPSRIIYSDFSSDEDTFEDVEDATQCIPEPATITLAPPSSDPVPTFHFGYGLLFTMTMYHICYLFPCYLLVDLFTSVLGTLTPFLVGFISLSIGFHFSSLDHSITPLLKVVSWMIISSKVVFYFIPTLFRYLHDAYQLSYAGPVIVLSIVLSIWFFTLMVLLWCSFTFSWDLSCRIQTGLSHLFSIPQLQPQELDELIDKPAVFKP